MGVPSEACNFYSVKIRNGQSLTSSPLPKVH